MDVTKREHKDPCPRCTAYARSTEVSVSREYTHFLVFCSHCHWKSRSYESLEAALASWYAYKGPQQDGTRVVDCE